ncbi:MAG: DNA recombination protein RmuC [bacterium]
MANILFGIIIILNLAMLYFIFKAKDINNDGKIDKIIENSNEKLRKNIKEEISYIRKELSEGEKRTREELGNLFKSFGDSIDKRMSDFSVIQNKNFENFSLKLEQVIEKNEIKMEKIKGAVEQKLEAIQKDNSEKLERIRMTVDEKLHDTLEKRLTASFKLVSERLEMVQNGLGDMRSLATGVGDLKKVLQNVKTRGTWGEVQLGNLLEQILTQEQYDKNIITKTGSNNRVEFAIKLPSKDQKNKFILMPIDAKFPLEDYQRLIEAQDKGDIAAIEQFSKSLENRIKLEAKNIKEKYIDPPYTTDFGILFLPIEGLYAEILRRPGITEILQRDFKVMISGPTTIAAFMNCLQMGFRTLAIEKRSSEVWEILGIVKNEFSKFGGILEATQKKLQQASNSIADATTKTRTIERKLSKVQELPQADTVQMITASENAEEVSSENMIF